VAPTVDQGYDKIARAVGGGGRRVTCSAVRIARFASPSGGIAFGVVEGEPEAPYDALTVAAIAEHPFGPIAFTGERWALPDVQLLAPVFPTKIIGIGRNYAEHAAEFGNEVPEAPLLFLKPPTAVIGPRDTVRLPPDSQRVEFEGELALVVGGLGARNVPREKALDMLLGYTCGNDVTARDQQLADGQWTRAKGYDSFCPLGPWIETVLDPGDVRLTTELDGEVKQDARTSMMIHDVPTLISYVSHVMTLLPGDVILSGTPAGVGPMRDGQTVSVTIEGIGTLANPVRAR
jgi:2-keto-4-pentenoate hydratase/2-oxohepta-3-ene-1,7-dioic acid hydratase in catechol pathway